MKYVKHPLASSFPQKKWTSILCQSQTPRPLKKFYYHKQNTEYVNRKLGELNIDPGQELQKQYIDQNNQNKHNNSSNSEIEVRLPGFEPGYSAWEADVLPS